MGADDADPHGIPRPAVERSDRDGDRTPGDDRWRPSDLVALSVAALVGIALGVGLIAVMVVDARSARDRVAIVGPFGAVALALAGGLVRYLTGWTFRTVRRRSRDDANP